MRRRERIQHGGVTPAYVRRDDDGRFKEFDIIKRSMPVDRAKKATRVVPPGQGDQGDQKKRG